MLCFDIFQKKFLQSHSLLKSMITSAIYFSAGFHIRCTFDIITRPTIWKAAKHFPTVNFILFLLLAKEKNEKYRHVHFSDDLLVEGKWERCLSHTQTLKSFMPPNQNIIKKLWNWPEGRAFLLTCKLQELMIVMQPAHYGSAMELFSKVPM